MCIAISSFIWCLSLQFLFWLFIQGNIKKNGEAWLNKLCVCGNDAKTKQLLKLQYVRKGWRKNSQRNKQRYNDREKSFPKRKINNSQTAYTAADTHTTLTQLHTSTLFEAAVNGGDENGNYIHSNNNSSAKKHNFFLCFCSFLFCCFFFSFLFCVWCLLLLLLLLPNNKNNWNQCKSRR